MGIMEKKMETTIMGHMGLGKNPLVRIYTSAVLFAASLVKR